MKEKMDGKFTVRVATAIPKTLHSRDSAERLVRAVVSLWRKRPRELKRDGATLILDFNEIEHLSESAADVLIEFREEFSEAKDPEIQFSNLSDSVDKALVAAEKNLRRLSRGSKTRKRNQNNYSIEV